MGLFDKIFKAAPEETQLTQQEAFAGIALAMAGADGSIAESEWAGIVNYIRRLGLYDNFSNPAFDKLFDKLFRILKKYGSGALVKASTDNLSEDFKLTVFACAVDIALADGVLEEEEKDIINQMAASLSIPEDIAISIIEVMIIKNKAGYINTEGEQDDRIGPFSYIHILSLFKMAAHIKSKITTYLTLVIGSLALLAVAGRVYVLHAASQEMIHISGTIVCINSERVYRPRKNIYKYTAWLEYKVNGYTQSVRTELYNPFLSEGSILSLWYHPSHTHKVILPSQECILCGVVGLFGLFCFLVGFILLKSKA